MVADVDMQIMTSRENNNSTEKFFEKHDFFGLPQEDVKFFKQGELPMVDTNGKLMLDVVHHDGTNHLEIREITKKGREVIDNDYGYVDKAAFRKGCTRNVKFTKKYY